MIPGTWLITENDVLSVSSTRCQIVSKFESLDLLVYWETYTVGLCKTCRVFLGAVTSRALFHYNVFDYRAKLYEISLFQAIDWSWF